MSHTEYDDFPARIDHSNAARTEHAAPVDVADGGHLVRYRYPTTQEHARDADACYLAFFYPAYRHYWQQTQFQSKLDH